MARKRRQRLTHVDGKRIPNYDLGSKGTLVDRPSKGRRSAPAVTPVQMASKAAGRTTRGAARTAQKATQIIVKPVGGASKTVQRNYKKIPKGSRGKILLLMALIAGLVWWSQHNSAANAVSSGKEAKHHKHHHHHKGHRR